MRYFKTQIWLIVIALIVILCGPARATQNTVFPKGRVDVSVPASQSINVFTAGTCRVYKLIGGPTINMPQRYVLETNGNVAGNEVTFGPYTNATTVRIEADADPVYYAVGALTYVLPVLRNTPRPNYTQLTPIAYTGTATLLASDLMNGIITATDTAAATVTYTLPTGTLTDAATGIAVNQGFEWSFINLSADSRDTVAIAAGTGHTLVGSPNIMSPSPGVAGVFGSAASARFYTRKTAANTFVTYRLR